jgi:undecaprenyl-diphosphatase
MDIKSLLQVDYQLSKNMGVAEKDGILRTAAAILAHSGDSWFWAVALLSIWIFVPDTGWKKWAVLLAGSIAVLIVLVFALKRSIRRPRPEGMWGMIYRRTDPHSFPSGHAARAFLIAVVATALGPSWLAIALWIWAPLVSVSRVAMGVHYVSDIIGGLILGLLTGSLLVSLFPAIVTFVSTRFPWVW